MKQSKLRYAAALFCNLVIVLLEIWVILNFFFPLGIGRQGLEGPVCFHYFTIDSNILAALSSLLMIPFLIRALHSEAAALPRWVFLVRFMALTAISLTFVTVVFFLAPFQGVTFMLTQCNFFLHLLCPALFLVSFFFLEPDSSLTRREALWGFTFFVPYAIVYLTCVVLLGTWEDIYWFNRHGLWPVSLVLMSAAVFLICQLLQRVYTKIKKNSLKS